MKFSIFPFGFDKRTQGQIPGLEAVEKYETEYWFPRRESSNDLMGCRKLSSFHEEKFLSATESRVKNLLRNKRLVPDFP